jgi:hypothetical protein|tara:strand:+ start:789 stop:1019 length:231 start_codon:yes stop_codon:yes gene_type:complete
MSEILQVEDIEVLECESTDQVQLRIVAIIDDMVQTHPAILFPADIAEPAQFGPARAVTTVTLELGGSDLEWEVLEQ